MSISFLCLDLECREEHKISSKGRKKRTMPRSLASFAASGTQQIVLLMRVDHIVLEFLCYFFFRPTFML